MNCIPHHMHIKHYRTWKHQKPNFFTIQHLVYNQAFRDERTFFGWCVDKLTPANLGSSFKTRMEIQGCNIHLVLQCWSVFWLPKAQIKIWLNLKVNSLGMVPSRLWISSSRFSRSVEHLQQTPWVKTELFGAELFTKFWGTLGLALHLN